MPTYNHARFLKEAMESVLNQSHENLELIIVDNFSEDNTEEVVRSYRDERIRYFKFRNNGVIAASRNHGIRQARGEWVAFIDSDDLWTRDKLALQLASFGTNPKAGICYGRFQVKSDDPLQTGRVIGPKRGDQEGEIYHQLINFNFIVSSSVMVTAVALEKVGAFDEDPALRCAEDFDLWLRITKEYEGIFIKDILGFYREHGANASAQDMRLERAFQVIDKHLSLGYIMASEARKARAHFYIHVGWSLIEADPQRARFYFRKAVASHYKSGKVIAICLPAIIMTALPFIPRYLKKKKIDRAIASGVNAQRL